MKRFSCLFFLMSLMMTAQQKKSYFVHLTSDPMKNPSSAMMSIAAASEALKQGHHVTFFAAGDGTKILIKVVIQNLHTVTSLGGGTNKISQRLEKSISNSSHLRRNIKTTHVQKYCVRKQKQCRKSLVRLRKNIHYFMVVLINQR